MGTIKYYIYFLLGKLRRQFFMQIPESDLDYHQSLKWFVLDGAMATTIGLLAGGAFLASLLKALGISETLNGIITSMASLVCIAQVFGVYLAKRMKKIKLFVCAFALIHRLIFSSLFFIPFLNLGFSTKIVLFIIMYLSAHILGQIIGPAAGNWISSLIITKRGSYFAKRDIIMVIVSVLVSLVAGQIFDYFQTSSNSNLSFLFVGFMMLIFTLVNFIALTMIKEPKFSFISSNNLEMHGTLVKKRVSTEILHQKHETFIDTFTKVISDKQFRKVIILTLLWQSAFFFSTPYFGIYQVSDLNLSYTYLMAMGFVGNILRIIVAPKCGKIADKKSWSLVLKFCISLLALDFLINTFTVPSNAHLFFAIFSIISGVAWAGIGPGMFSIQLDFSPSGDRTEYLGINAAIMGTCGFLSSLVGGSILQFILNHNNSLFGIQLYGQQVLSFISGILLFVLVLYIHFGIEKNQSN
ncbi:MAG: MFS transporter [Cellulosilyticaceae bacterium]